MTTTSDPKIHPGDPSNAVSAFIRQRRHRLGLTQAELANRAGVGIRFIRDIEQHKVTLRCDKVNQVLAVFGHVLAPVSTRSLAPTSASESESP
jgi:y4mF family transcriptional regulator